MSCPRNQVSLRDCYLTIYSIAEVVPTSEVETAFTNVDVAILVGAMPRKQGMERKDLLKANVKIFKQQGQALDTKAKKNVKVGEYTMSLHLFGQSDIYGFEYDKNVAVALQRQLSFHQIYCCGSRME